MRSAGAKERFGLGFLGFSGEGAVEREVGGAVDGVVTDSLPAMGGGGGWRS